MGSKLPLQTDCRLIRLDASGLAAVDKGVGVLSHPNREKDKAPAILPWPYDFETEAFQGPGITWHLLNRLDAPTSGVILLADNPDLAAAVKAAFAEHQVDKTYVALVKGRPPRKTDHWRDCLLVRKRGRTVRTEAVRGKPNAACRMELIRQGLGPPARSLIALYPETGRTHQLRVQCASRRLPIIGDATYGDFGFNREFKRRLGIDRLYLHSWKTELRVPLKGQVIHFQAESPLPEAFTVALG